MKTREEIAPVLLSLTGCVLFSTTALAQPIWVEQGPGPCPGQGVGNKVSGRIVSLAADPSNSNRVFAAANNGGVWRTDNGTDDSPMWRPLTDQFPSFSMHGLTFQPPDTVFAARPDGILKTTDGGDNWTLLGTNVFLNQQVFKVLPTPGGQVVFAVSSGGLYRSDNAGINWSKKSGANGLPNWSYVAIVEDPGNAQRLFIAADNPPRVFRSENLGTNWTELTSAIGLPDDFFSPTRLAISPKADSVGYHWLYLLVANIPSTNGAIGKVFVSRNNGANWSALDALPGDPFHAELVVSPKYVSIVFALINERYRGDAQSPPGSQWTQVQGANAGGTYPHVDGWDWVFSADPNLMYEADDGGVFRLKDPVTLSPRWENAVGNLRVTEFYSVAYDTVNHTIFGGAQDVSTPHQTVPGSTEWGQIENVLYDGVMAAVDNTATQGASIHYNSVQFFNYPKRRTYTSPTGFTEADIGIIVNNTGNRQIYALEDALTPNATDDRGTIGFLQKFAINNVDGRRLLLGTDYLYESLDRGEHFESLGGLRQNGLDQAIPDNPVGRVTAYAYGHPQNADIFYVGTTGVGSLTNIPRHLLWVRSSGTGYPAPADAYQSQNVGGSIPYCIVMDPNDWRRAYIVDSRGQIWRTTDAGATVGNWVNLTGNLYTCGVCALKAGSGSTVELFSPTEFAHEQALLIGGIGGVFVLRNPSAAGTSAQWERLGDNLPNTIVSDLHYYPQDNLLLAGTYGRGAWTIPNVSHAIFPNDCFITGLVLTVPFPFPTVRFAHDVAAVDCSIIRVTTGTYHEAPLRLYKHVRLESQGGPVTITR